MKTIKELEYMLGQWQLGKIDLPGYHELRELCLSMQEKKESIQGLDTLNAIIEGEKE